MQYQTPAELRKVFGGDIEPSFSEAIEYDAAADWYVESYESYQAAYKDPYYIDIIEPDEQNFVDKGQVAKPGNEGKKTVITAMSTLGYCRSMIKDGKPAVEVKDEIWEKFKEFRSRESRSE